MAMPHDPLSGQVPVPRKGRGAATNPPSRFDRQWKEPFDDGWGTLATDLAAPPPLPTTLIPDRSRSALSWNDSPDLGFDRSLNPYRGCEHGCIYCYARPSHGYLGFSPGLDFETRLVFKPEIVRLLARELARPGYRPRPIALGGNTDPYQPIERRLRLTRGVLQLLASCAHPVTIITKSAGVLRDLDLLTTLAARNLVAVSISLTTLDAALARRMEPRAASPARRLEAIRALAAAGIPTAVLAAPMIPGLNDAELEAILEAAAAAGAKAAGYVLLRLPYELGDLFTEWLTRHYPERASKVLALIRQSRAGKLYDSRFGQRHRGSGPYAALLAQRFSLAARRFGLDEGGIFRLETAHFRPPVLGRGGQYGPDQPSLF